MKINLDSPVISFLNKVADFMILNILFILCCAPIVTIGPALSALFTITMREADMRMIYIKTFLQSISKIIYILVFFINIIFVFGSSYSFMNGSFG